MKSRLRNIWNKIMPPHDRGDDATPGREPDPMFHTGPRIPPDSPQRGTAEPKADE